MHSIDFGQMSSEDTPRMELNPSDRINVARLDGLTQGGVTY